MLSVSWQNVLTFCLILAVLLAMFSLCSCALASASDSLVPSDQNMAVFINNSNETYYARSVIENESSPSVYCGFVGNSLVFLSRGEARFRYGKSSNLANYTISYDSQYAIYKTSFSPSHVATKLVPIYSSLEDFISALPPDEPESPPSLTSLSYSLPPGNIAFVSVSAGVTYSLHCYMPESVLGSNHYPGNNQVVTLVNSLPSGGRAPSSPLIPWEQQGALSYLGLSRHAGYSSSVASAGYLCIVNPLYYSGTANGPYEFLSNGSIDITVSSANGITVYPLDSTLGFTSGLGIGVTTDILPGSYTGEVDPDSGVISWTDSDGGSSAPTTGGGNLVETGETIFDFLRHISEEIASFLRGPISAVKTVVAALRDFMTSFVQLYQWLPSPVYNLITAGLMIAVTIGVIKIFV